MGGVQCAKVIIDQSAGLKSQLTRQSAGLQKALDCMSNTITLSSGSYTYPSDEQEDRFVKACDEALAIVRTAVERVAALSFEIEKDVRERAEIPRADIPPDIPPRRT